MGLCFSVNKGIKHRFSAEHVQRTEIGFELQDSHARGTYRSGNRKRNTDTQHELNRSCVPTRTHTPKKVWEQFTDKAIEELAKARRILCFCYGGRTRKIRKN